jgi:oligosaccharyltransferase complex subunit beta
MAVCGKLLCFLALLAVSPFHQVRAFSEEKPTDQRILVLLDDFGIRATHSIYFKSLTDRGYELDFKLADDASLALQKYGDYLYDALIFFAPTFDVLGGSLDVAAILEFIDSGHDVVLAAEGGASDVVRDIATECGVDLDEEENAVVIDHINNADLAADHTVIAASDLIKSKAILGPKRIEAPVLFRGIGMGVNPSNELVVKVLTAPPTTFSSSPSAKQAKVLTASGKNLVLVAVLQARNHARVLISGSLDLFSDKFFRRRLRRKFLVVHPSSLRSRVTSSLPLRRPSGRCTNGAILRHPMFGTTRWASRRRELCTGSRTRWNTLWTSRSGTAPSGRPTWRTTSSCTSSS